MAVFFFLISRFSARGPRIVIPSALANWLSARWEPRTNFFCGVLARVVVSHQVTSSDINPDLLENQRRNVMLSRGCL